MVSKLLNKKQYKFHYTIKQNNQYSLQLKVDIVLNMQTNACEYKRQVFK